MQLVDWRLTWLQVKYYVDPAYMKTGESRHFLQHLSQHSLHIDVWDGESLLLIGSCSVDLKVCSPSIGLLCVISHLASDLIRLVHYLYFLILVRILHLMA